MVIKHEAFYILIKGKYLSFPIRRGLKPLTAGWRNVLQLGWLLETDMSKIWKKEADSLVTSKLGRTFECDLLNLTWVLRAKRSVTFDDFNSASSFLKYFRATHHILWHLQHFLYLARYSSTPCCFGIPPFSLHSRVQYIVIKTSKPVVFIQPAFTPGRVSIRSPRDHAGQWLSSLLFT